MDTGFRRYDGDGSARDGGGAGTREFRNPTARDDPPMLMHELLLRGAECRPDKLAFRWVDRDRSLTYGEAADADGDASPAPSPISASVRAIASPSSPITASTT